MADQDQPNAKAFSYVAKGLEEFSRLVGIMIALFAALWFFGSAAAQQFVLATVNAQNYAYQKDLSDVKIRVEKLDGDQSTLSNNIERLNVQVGDIKDLATEQRSTLNQILLVIKKP